MPLALVLTLLSALMTGLTGAPVPPMPTSLHAAMALPKVDAVSVGQLFMTGTTATGVDAATRSAVTRYHVGGVMLRGRSSLGVRATARITEDLRSLATARATGGRPLLVSTDQEGGQVQVLQGPGFSEMPSALEQGRLPDLRARAGTWGAQLHRAGIDLDLAPVLDTVPSASFAPENAPIGAFQREFGYRPAQVASAGTAVMRGMGDARVATSVKHFPGLGRVTGNTDTESDVHDPRTTAGDPALRPFRTAIRAGAPLVMVSNATYDRIDPSHPAAYSHTIITGLLRQRLGFDGVVISDDLSEARAVATIPAGQRAVRFLRAGGDLVLAVDPTDMKAMTEAVLAEARRDPAFEQKVQQAILRVQSLRDRYAR